MPQIFLSYSHTDLTKIQELKLIESLEKDNKYHVWQDTQSIQGGEAWLKVIQDALESSVAVVVFVTNSTLESQWVMFECAYAIGWNIPVVPYYNETILETMKNKPLYNLLSQKQHAENLDKLYNLVQTSSKPSFFSNSYNQNISELLLKFRICSEMLCMVWGNGGFDFSHKLVYIIRDELYDLLHTALSDFWTKFHGVLDTRQRKDFVKLTNILNEIRIAYFDVFKLPFSFYEIESTNFRYPSSIESEFTNFAIKLKELEAHISRSFHYEIYTEDDFYNLTYDRFQNVIHQIENKELTLKEAFVNFLETEYQYKIDLGDIPF